MYRTMLLLILFFGNNLADTGEALLLVNGNPMTIRQTNHSSYHHVECHFKAGKKTCTDISNNTALHRTIVISSQDEAILLVNDNPVLTKEGISSEYNAVGDYYFDAGETVHVACNSRAQYKYWIDNNIDRVCDIRIRYFNSKGDNVQSDGPKSKECEPATLELKLDTHSDNSYVICEAYEYKTKITLHLTPLLMRMHEAVHKVNISWSLVVAAFFGALGSLLLIGFCIYRYRQRATMDNKKQVAEGNENRPISCNSRPQSGPNEEERIYCEPTYIKSGSHVAPSAQDITTNQLPVGSGYVDMSSNQYTIPMANFSANQPPPSELIYNEAYDHVQYRH